MATSDLMTTDQLTSTGGRAPGGPVAGVRSWPVLLLAAPAFVAIWAGWVGLGALTGFGVIHPLPGIWDSARLDTAITLPVGVETYAAYALRVWLTARSRTRASTFARRSAIGSLILGAGGQVAYHLMSARGMVTAPWPITAVVACLPVAVLGMGAALAHLVHHDTHHQGDQRGDASGEQGSEMPPATGTAGDESTPEPAGQLEEARQVEDSVPGEPVQAPVVETGPVEAGPVTAPSGPVAAGAGRGGRSGRARPVAAPGGRRSEQTSVVVVRLRARYPGWTVAQIAKRAGVNERTVRRHLTAARSTDGNASSGARGAAERRTA